MNEPALEAKHDNNSIANLLVQVLVHLPPEIIRKSISMSTLVGVQKLLDQVAGGEAIASDAQARATAGGSEAANRKPKS